MPTSEAAIEVITNSVIFVRVTGTPAFRAATASPPDAKIQLPNTVRVSRIVATAVRAIHHTSEIWNDAPPIGIVVASTARADSNPVACSIPDTRTVPVRPFVIARFAPFSTKNGAERHDERGQSGAHDEHAVDEADHRAEQQCGDDRGPHRPAQLRDEQAREQPGGTDHHARRTGRTRPRSSRAPRRSRRSRRAPRSRSSPPRPRASRTGRARVSATANTTNTAIAPISAPSSAAQHRAIPRRA